MRSNFFDSIIITYTILSHGLRFVVSKRGLRSVGEQGILVAKFEHSL